MRQTDGFCFYHFYCHWDCYARHWATLVDGKQEGEHQAESHSKVDRKTVSQSSQGPIQRKKTQETTQCRIGCKQLRKDSIKESLASYPVGGSSSHEGEPADLLLIEKNHDKWVNNSKPPSTHNILSHSPANPTCETCTLTRTTRARCQDSAEILGDGMELLKKTWRSSHSGSQSSDRGK